MLLDLDPYVIQFGNFGIRWYGFFMALSMGIGFYYFLKNGRKLGYDEEFLYNAGIVTLFGGIVGARIIYVLTNLGDFAGQPLEVFRIDHGGLSWHGGLGGGILGGTLYARRKGVRDWFPLADLTVPGLAVGYILVRLGNIFNQELLGRTGDLLPFDRHPAQLYGSAIGVAMLLLHNWLARRKPRPAPGYLFWAFFFNYSWLRGLVEETVRTNPLYIIKYINSDYGLGFTTMTQLFTPLFLLLSWLMMRYATQRAATARGAAGQGRHG